MSFSRVNVWSAGDKLIASQVNQLDTNITNCVDIRTGSVNAIRSRSTFYDNNVFTAQTNFTNTSTSIFNGEVRSENEINFITPKTRSIFIPMRVMEPEIGTPNLEVSSTVKALSYYILTYNNTHNNTSVRFLMDLSVIPQGASLQSLKLIWAPFNFSVAPTSFVNSFSLRYRRSVNLVTETITQPYGSTTGADIEVVEYNAYYNWVGDQNNQTLTMDLSGLSLVHEKSGEMHSVSIDLGTLANIGASRLLLFGIQVNYTESIYGLP